MNKLKVGVAKVNISPPIRTPLSGYYAEEGRVDSSRAIHDNLYAKTLVLGNGQEQVVFITTDLVALPREVVLITRELIERETGIKKEKILISASHTHSGPVVFFGGEELFGKIDTEYLVVLSRKMAGAVYTAYHNMKEAKVGIGKGSSNININRREKREDGTFVIGKNPKGIVDREVGVLRFDDSEGMMATLINYTCHAVTLGPNLEISADYPGYTMGLIEEMGKGKVIALFTNGTQGNINPVVTPEIDVGGFEDVKRLGLILGTEVLRVSEQIEPIACTRLKSVSREIELPLNKALPHIKEVEKSIEQRENQYKHLKVKKSKESLERKNESIRQYLKRNNLEDELQLSIAKGQLYLRKYLEGKGNRVDIQVVAINDTIFASVPGEMFVEIGLDIKKRSKYKNTFLVGLANGYFGYIPTRDAYGEGGYETGATPLAPEASELISNTILELIEEL